MKKSKKIRKGTKKYPVSKMSRFKAKRYMPKPKKKKNKY
jgi:hypothetical protein